MNSETMGTNEVLAREAEHGLARTIEETIATMGKASEAMARAESELDRRAARIGKLLMVIEEIEAYAEDKYDGPEDRHWGWVLARCRDARGR